MNAVMRKKQICTAKGECRAELVLKNAGVINVFTDSIETCDVAVNAGQIVGLGRYSGEKEIDMTGKYICPGLIDGHIHLESSMICGPEFEQAVLPHGTTAVVTDPHEIGNVAGLNGIDFMLETTKDLALSVYFMMPSCVPSTSLDESGAVLTAKELNPYYKNERVLGLAELMDFYGTVDAKDEIVDKICGAVDAGKLVDGHAPFLKGKDLNAYVMAGVQSDHECSDINEAMEKLSRGQYIMIREGTAAKNLEALMPLFKEPYCNRCMLVTDDKHPGDLINGGHIDYIIRKAIRYGAEPIIAVKMGALIPAQYFGLKARGAIAPGYAADMIVLSDLYSFKIEQVYKAGKLVAENGEAKQKSAFNIDKEKYTRVYESFHMKEITPEDLQLKEQGKQERVIQLTPHELITSERIVPFVTKDGVAPGVDLEQDIVKMAVFERHHNSGHVGLGFLGGYGLKRGAVASSVAHDSHNLIVTGTNDADMVLAGNTVRKNKGGLAFVVDGKVLGELPLPIAGLISDKSAHETEAILQALKNQTKKYGIAEDIDAFMTLAFTSLPVIPRLRLNTYGVVDVDAQKIVASVF